MCLRLYANALAELFREVKASRESRRRDRVARALAWFSLFFIALEVLTMNASLKSIWTHLDMEVPAFSRIAVSNWWSAANALLVAAPLAVSYLDRFSDKRRHQAAWIAAALGIGGCLVYLWAVPLVPPQVLAR